QARELRRDRQREQPPGELRTRRLNRAHLDGSQRGVRPGEARPNHQIVTPAHLSDGVRRYRLTRRLGDGALPFRERIEAGGVAPDVQRAAPLDERIRIELDRGHHHAHTQALRLRYGSRGPYLQPLPRLFERPERRQRGLLVNLSRGLPRPLELLQVVL